MSSTPQDGQVARAVILAAGRGTRMRRPAPGVPLDDAQRRMADLGLKGLVPFHGHPYLSYVIAALADAGIREVCLVVPPGEHPIRAHYQALATERVRIAFAVQDRPLGSAHALLAAERFAAGEPFIVINSDNLYPPSAVAALHGIDGSGLAAFRRERLVAGGNIPAERVAAYALVTADAEGCLDEIVEKPTPDAVRRLEGCAWVSMTLWRFGPSIFEACRAIRPSARGELELPDAVAWATRVRGERFRLVPVDDAVLDLSCREDVPGIAERLEGVAVRL
ncbi:MAG TPA: nucleotidyltransferase family protein [Longimicrobiales bacterium]